MLRSRGSLLHLIGAAEPLGMNHFHIRKKSSAKINLQLVSFVARVTIPDSGQDPGGSNHTTGTDIFNSVASFKGSWVAPLHLVLLAPSGFIIIIP
jgi:hypothetical protein